MPDHDQTKTEYTSGAGCLTRLYWMFAGNTVLFIVFGLLIDKHPEFPALLDAAYLLTVASLVAVRYIDIRHCKGETGDGKPATMNHWRKYSTYLVTGSVAAWVAVRLVFPLFMK